MQERHKQTKNLSVDQQYMNNKELTCIDITFKAIPNVALAARAGVRTTCVCTGGVLITVVSLSSTFVYI